MTFELDSKRIRKRKENNLEIVVLQDVDPNARRDRENVDIYGKQASTG